MSMRVEKILNKFELTTNKWLNALSQYSEEEFNMKPSDNDWSLAEVYDHINQVSNECLTRAMACAKNKGQNGHSGFGPAIFSLMGSFPPVKLKIKKIPVGLEKIYAPQKINKTEAEKQLNEIKLKMKYSIQQIKFAGNDNRIEHWAGGWFNAKQWYQNAEMHIRHHLRQKKRIDKFISKNKKQV